MMMLSGSQECTGGHEHICDNGCIREAILTLMGKGAMEADLFGDGRSIFTDGLGDGRLGRAIGDTGKDDPAFFQGQV